jgi:hypothetical protein
MRKNEIKNKKDQCLKNIKKSELMYEKLMWQNIYFWYLFNEDRLLTNQSN